MDRETLVKVVSDANKFLINRPSLSIIGMVYYGLKRIYASGEDFFKWSNKDGAGNSCLAYTDGEKIVFYIPPELKKENREKFLKQFIFVAAHEVMHVISDHVPRGIGRLPLLWNVAVDHVVNRLCVDLGHKNGIMEMPEGCIFFRDIHHKDPTISAEKVYDILLQQSDRYEISEVDIFPDQNQQSQGSGSGSGDGEEEREGESSGSGNDESSNSNDQKNSKSKKSKKGKNNNKDKDSGGEDQQDSKEKDQSSGSDQSNKSEEKRKKIIIVKDKHTGETFYALNDTDTNNLDKKSSDVQDRMRELRESAQSVWRSNSIDKGDVPGEFASYLDEIFKIEIPWYKLLEEAILYPVTACKRTSWTWPNIYIRTPRLPGKIRNTQPYTLVCGVDSSGSISDENLKKFLGVICSSHRYFKKIIVIVHDYVIQDYITITNTSSEEYVFQQIRKVKGRGGTSHRDVFNKIEEISGFEKISSVLFLTDYYSDVESIYKDYKWIKNFDTDWVLVDNKREVTLDGCKTKTICI